MFRHKLALRLGMTLAELDVRMSAGELAEWMAFNTLSPIGDERADMIAGLSTMTLLQPHVKRGTRLKLSDFVPNWGGKIRQSADLLRAKVLGTFKAANMLRQSEK